MYTTNQKFSAVTNIFLPPVPNKITVSINSYIVFRGWWITVHIVIPLRWTRLLRLSMTIMALLESNPDVTILI